ncbi:MAG: C4-dicarboxylate transporter DctA [Pirellula sp.]|jgi:aerobic C4-dicarboxylate transport protein|nr:C4-dicarboxylate transporter DctA [Pirellula sp.]
MEEKPLEPLARTATHGEKSFLVRVGSQLYVQTLIGVFLGGLLGWLDSDLGKSLKPLGEAFVNLIKMMIGPIIFCTIVHGIASVGSLRLVGRLGLKVLIYFEVVSTLALLIGLVVVNVSKPGVGFSTPEQMEQFLTATESRMAETTAAATQLSVTDFLLHLIPKTIVSPFVSGDLLQILVVSLLAAIAILGLGERRRAVLDWIDIASSVFFGILKILVRFAPIGAFGAMAFTVAEFQGDGLLKLLRFMLLFYATAFVFIAGVLGFIARWCGFSLWRFVLYIKEEILLVLGTSSSETALPGLMKKLEGAGCSRSTVGLVVPTGYSFNLDGTNIYMSMAALFVAQATGVTLSWEQQLWLLAVAMLTSKGASGVTGAGFVTLIATLQVFPQIPVAAAFLLLGIDRFMSECRALTNFLGNGVAALVISRWEGEIGGKNRPIVFPVDERSV